jgi:hypothetical protein
MLHEVFHCFEAQLESSIGTFNSATKAEARLIEGAADWVAHDFVARSSAASPRRLPVRVSRPYQAAPPRTC